MNIFVRHGVKDRIINASPQEKTLLHTYMSLALVLVHSKGFQILNKLYTLVLTFAIITYETFTNVSIIYIKLDFVQLKPKIQNYNYY